MRKIMWLCNTPLPEVQAELGIKVCGEGWLQGISDQLRRREDIELYYVFPQKKSKRLFRKCIDNISFWGFYSDGGNVCEFSSDRQRVISGVIKQIRPDIIHIFGTEFVHSLECIQAVQNGEKVIVSIQGLISELAKAYTKKVSIKEQIYGAGSSGNLLEAKYEFYKRGVNEKAILKKTSNVIGRTAWDKRCVKKINPKCRYFYCSETLRKDFYEGKWDIGKIRRHSIYISQADYPIKGFHVFIKAFSEVMQSFSDACVYVAGRKAFLQTGGEYGRYINKLMERYGVKSNIKFLGELSAEEVKQNLMSAHITVMPSLLENSPNSIGEAMLLGTPIVAAKVGGIPSLVRNEREALLYSDHNARKLSESIKRIFDSDNLACDLSIGGRRRARKLYDRDANLKQLIKIYDAIEK